MSLRYRMSDSTSISGNDCSNRSFTEDYDFNFNQYDYDIGNEYMYPGYYLERTMYFYIWETLVIITFLVNIIVVSVLMKRKMRNTTNMVLTAIAISDSLTGMVTLTTYTMVYRKIQECYYYNDPSKLTNDYILSRGLCRGSMISKYLLSRSFHLVSIFLTLFLAIQRYVSIVSPFKSESLPRVSIRFLFIFLLSLALNAYHRDIERVLHLPLVCFFIRDLIPCVMLPIFTALLIRQIQVENNYHIIQLSNRVEENRRISITVTAVVIVFLVPDIPYAMFWLLNEIEKTKNDCKGIHLETKETIHMTYDILLVLSFHANVYIYTFFNRRFRKCLYRTCVKPIQRYVNDASRLSISRTIGLD